MMTTEKNMKLLPKGMSNYRDVREQNRYYVDKTMYLPTLERAGNFLFLVRPRRFGKSLFLSMMSFYYDIAEADNFDRLFAGTWIAEHPTPEKNKYLIMKLDFSRIGGSATDIATNFDIYGSPTLDIFVIRYKALLGEEILKGYHEQARFMGKFEYIMKATQAKGLPIFLIIDEYDNFTNNVLNQEGDEVYRALTHGEGFYRTLFMKFKGAFPKILMMGVSPVTLDDLTSGYNIATNITADPRFNMMLGFSENDVREMIEYYRGYGQISRPTDDIIAEMKPWYDGYCFASRCLDSDPKMFNSNMVLYYLNNLIDLDSVPETMVDPNTRTDYNKMKKIIQLDRLDETRRSIVHRIAEEGFIYGTLVEQFPAEALIRKENFISLLYYYGMLTISGTRGMMLKLGIPNNNVRRQYYGYLMEEYDAICPWDESALLEPFYAAAVDGDWRPMLTTMADAYEKNSAVRSLIEGERNIQGFFTAYLSLNLYYLTAPEMELQHGYCDFFLMPDTERYPMVNHAYILELKYLPAGATPEAAARQWDEAVNQIRHYATDGRLPHYLQGRQLHLLVVQFVGSHAQRMEEV